MTEKIRPGVLARRALPALAVLTAVAGSLLLVLARPALAQTAGTAVTHPELASWAYVAAALSTGLAALAAGYAVGRVGSAGIGAIAEKPELFGRILVLVGLAEGIAIYGLIISILILNRV
jgi:V/A-type H+-transporting ATPase subunit K